MTSERSERFRDWVDSPKGAPFRSEALALALAAAGPAPETETEDPAYAAYHLGLLKPIREHRKEAKEHTEAADGASRVLRAYMETEGETEVIDGEHGLRAVLRERSAWEWDLRGADFGIIMELQEKGLLKVDNAAYNALRGAAPSVHLDDAARFRRQVAGSTALYIEDVK